MVDFIDTRGFYNRGEWVFFDIRVFDPLAPSYWSLSLDATYKNQEDYKQPSYEVKSLRSFTPQVFSTMGSMLLKSAAAHLRTYVQKTGGN